MRLPSAAEIKERVRRNQAGLTDEQARAAAVAWLEGQVPCECGHSRHEHYQSHHVCQVCQDRGARCVAFTAPTPKREQDCG